MSEFLIPFTYFYMQYAMIAAVLVGILCSLLSVFLMLKRWALIGDALSHSVVPGVAVGYAFGFPYAIGAFVAGALASLSILFLNNLSKFKQDAVIGFVFSLFFALGLLIISLNPTSININAVIFGNLLAVDDFDLAQIIIISLLSLILFSLKWKDFLLIFFDEIQAKTSGIKILFLKFIFFAILTAAVVSSLLTVGAVLVIALLITPASTAYLLSNKFKIIMRIAIFIGAFSGFLGVYLSYFLNLPSGALIVFLQSLFFVFSLLYKKIIIKNE